MFYIFTPLQRSKNNQKALVINLSGFEVKNLATLTQSQFVQTKDFLIKSLNIHK